MSGLRPDSWTNTPGFPTTYIPGKWGMVIHRSPTRQPWQQPWRPQGPSQRELDMVRRIAERRALDQAERQAEQARRRGRVSVQAGSISGVGGGRATSSSWSIDWLRKIRDLRRERRFRIPYEGPGKLGPWPSPRTPLAHKIWEFIQTQKRWQLRQPTLFDQQRLPGNCYEVTLNRVAQGWKNAHKGRPLLAGRSTEELKVIDAIAGTRYGTYPRLWRTKVPRKLRYRGVPGALAYLGVADVVEGKDVWQGGLEPGAPLQIWSSGSLGGAGHSAAFERYVRDKKGKIAGLLYSDEWRDYGVVLRTSVGLVIGARFKRNR